MPNVEGEEAYWDIKLRAIETQQLGPEPKYQPIEMPVNSPVGFYTAFFASVTGFALIWQIWWLAGLGLVAAFIGFVVFAWRDVHEFHVPVEEVARVDRARRAAREAFMARLAQQGVLP
jgi:cytochrome o ubiquinol oxidase subunit 1